MWPLTSAQTEQHDVWLGMITCAAEHVNAGHGVGEHLMSSVIGSQVQMVHLSKPCGGKYGYHEEPAEWNWLPRAHFRGASVVLSPDTILSCGARNVNDTTNH